MWFRTERATQRLDQELLNADSIFGATPCSLDSSSTAWPAETTMEMKKLVGAQTAV
jgi:hypothetical protein